jgi:small subunit ribosomal protein S20
VANHKSAKKRIKQNETKRLSNQWKVSRLRTEIKKLKAFITESDKDGALKQYPVVQTLFAKLAKGSAIRKDTAARKTSRLAIQVSKL